MCLESDPGKGFKEWQAVNFPTAAATAEPSRVQWKIGHHRVVPESIWKKWFSLG